MHKFGKYQTTNRIFFNYFFVVCVTDVLRTAYLVRIGKSGSRDPSRSLSEALKFCVCPVVIWIVIIICSPVLQGSIRFTELGNSIGRHNRNVLLPRNATQQEYAVTKERHTKGNVLLPRNATQQECAVTKERHTTGMCCYQGTPHNRNVLLPRNATQQECAVTKERHTTGMRCYQGTPHNRNVLLPRNATQQSPPDADACYLLSQTCTSNANLKFPSINIQNTVTLVKFTTTSKIPNTSQMLIIPSLSMLYKT
jgi:hypothetical protein